MRSAVEGIIMRKTESENLKKEKQAAETPDEELLLDRSAGFQALYSG